MPAGRRADLDRAFSHGQKYLTEVADGKPGTGEPDTVAARATRALATYRLGWCLSRGRFGESDAAKRFGEAWQLDRSNPYYLTAYLEYEIRSTRSRDLVRVMEPAIREALATCRRHVEVGIDCREPISPALDSIDC